MIALTGHGVSSWRQYEHQWDCRVRVQVALTQVKGRGLHKLPPQLVSHIVVDGWYNLTNDVVKYYMNIHSQVYIVEQLP